MIDTVLSKRLFRTNGDFSGIENTIHLVNFCFQNFNKQYKWQFRLFVLFYVVAVTLNVASMFLFYKGLVFFLNPEEAPEIIANFVSSYYEVTQLVFLMVPAIVLIIFSSILLRYTRVRLSRLVISLKSNFLAYFFKDIPLSGVENKADLEKRIEAVFGVVRAIFLNSFVVIQSIISLFFIFWLDVYVGIYLLLYSLFFILAIANLKDKKATTDEEIGQDDAVEDEFVGLSSKSFERLERMRHFGRNANTFFMVGFVLLGLGLNLPFMGKIETFSILFLLIRYYGQLFVPFGVIAGASVPHRKMVNVLLNILNLNRLYLHVKDYKPQSTTVSLIVARSAQYRADILTGDTSLTVYEGISKTYPDSDFRIGTGQLTDKSLLSKKEQRLLLEKVFNNGGESDSIPKICFCL